MTTSGGYFFPLQDTKHKNTLWELYAIDSLFDNKYSQ